MSLHVLNHLARHAAWLLAMGLLFLAAPAAFAEPAPVLTTAVPAYLKQGDSLEMEIAGQNLGSITSVAIANARGVQAELVKSEKPNPAAAKVKLSAAPDAALGNRELRLITPTGVTAPLTVTVGQYAVLADKEPNDTAEQAQPIHFPVALTGKIDRPGDTDAFKFDATKGQQIVFDIYSGRVGSPLDPVLTVMDAAGKEQRRTTMHRGGDSTEIFEAPADGSYTLEIRDLQFRGGGDYAYRIDAGPIPYVDSIVPLTGQRGKVVEVHASGRNIQGAETIALDLTNAAPGPMPLRIKTAAGFSNEVLFMVGDVSQATEKEPNDAPEQATLVALPSEVSGILQKAGDEDFFKFSVPSKQSVTIEARARATGSPVDALLTLRNAKGDVIETTNGSREIEARIARDLEPGDYLFSIRDLTFAGGPSYGYRVNLFQAGGVPPDFTVRFLPDAPRLSRGGNVKLWCEVNRLNGYKGDVTLAVDDLPPGVTLSAPPGAAIIGENTSGVFTLSASADARLGSSPIRLKAIGALGASLAMRVGEPELNGRALQQAYVTVLDAAPFTVEAIPLIKPEQVAQYGKTVTELVARLNTQTPALDAAIAAWEKGVTGTVAWSPLDVATVTSANGVAFVKQPDGSYLATANNPDRDTVTVVANSDLKGITALRLEVLPDPSLPLSGPGRHGDNGNFVLTRFAVSAGPKSAKPDAMKPLPLASPRATFEQSGFGIASAIDDNPAGGWAIYGGAGKAQSATFYTQAPLGGDGGTTFTFTFDQQYGQQHTIGRFRLLATTDANALQADKQPLAAPMLAIVKTPADKRTPEQSAALAAYYRATGPELANDRARLEALRNGIGPYAEIARLEAILNTSTPALEAERTEWERSVVNGASWVALSPDDIKAANGTVLNREADDSISAVGEGPATDVYTIAASTLLKNLTAVKLEVLPDERLPASGPGRAKDGNFILTRFSMTAAPKPAASPTMPAPPASPDASKPPPAPSLPPTTPPTPVEFASAKATAEQAGWPAIGALDERPETGWAISPLAGRPASAVFVAKTPVMGEGGSALTFTLEQAAPQPQLARYTLGRFRLWVTSSAAPDTAANVPDTMLALLRVPANARGRQQRDDVNAYYRSIAPSLDPVRQRLAELRARVAPLPLVVGRDAPSVIPVPIDRSGPIKGDVTVTLEGFSAGRDPASRMPMPIARNIAVSPLVIRADEAFGRLTFRPMPTCELGSRMVVLRAESNVGGETIVQYSPAFPVTVTEK